LSFATATQLPSAAFVYRQAAVSLPEITLAQQVAPPPAAPQAQAQQPPPPPGYVQPPGYQDGVPFGGQLGAVPGSSTAGRPATGGGGTTRPAAPATYVVRDGDTLSSIAVRFYGNARFAATIWDANYRLIGANPNAIFPGQRLTLPGINTRPAASTPLPNRGPIGQRTNYTIQQRDFLRWMAQRAYGNEMRWPEIYRANRNQLGVNPDLIYPGVTVFIP
jgi:nucleoid-associated protein YgaU